MFSSSDSTESQNYTQWALNPSAYQNIANDQVDWAALAQQWIIMKEAGPPVPEQTPTTAAAAPRKSKPPPNVKEEGEAPMDVEKEEPPSKAPWSEGSGTQPGEPWNWNQQQQQPPWNNWGSSWNVPSGVPAPGSVKAPLLPTPPVYNQFGSSHEPAVADGPAFNPGYNSTSSTEFTSGYWTGNSGKIKPHNKRYSKVNVPVPNPVHEPVALDAAKRKQLPAWIREGLEKMERDKQKQLEREREIQLERDGETVKVKFTEKDALEIIKSTVKERQKSKFESDGEESEDSEIRGKALTPEPVAPLTQEELLLKVRRTMTEILLKVTNREIYQICREELQRHLKKLKASDHRVPASSGNNISSRLGLGMYGGDSGSSSGSEDGDGENRNENRDSDTELKDSIRRRKAEFSKTEREIEEKLADAERGAGSESKAATPERNDNDSQVDAKFQARKRHSSSGDKTPPPKTVPPENRRRSTQKRSVTSSDDSDSDRGKKRSKRRRKSRRTSSSDSSPSDRHRKKDDRRSSKSVRTRRSKSRDSRSKSRRDSLNSRYSKRSRSRSHSRSKRSRSSNRSDYKKSSKSKRSRSGSRSRRSRSRSPYGRSKKRSRSRRRSSSSSRRSYRYRRSRSSSSSRGKKSHRH